MPGLLPPREALAATDYALHAPHLKALLARARETREPLADDGALLCQAFGIAQQQDWPLAPLLARAAGLNATHGYWLCATPVHLETRRNALVLTGPAALNVSGAESAALAGTLAGHLGEEGVTLHVGKPGQWFVQIDVAPAMTTTPLERVLGRDVREFLPQGADARRWHRLMTEMQMLLHTHAVNDAREAAGEPPLNSVWLWGGGTLPAAAAAPITTAWSNDEVIRALAQHAGSRIEPPPLRITPGALDEGAHFFSADLLVAPLRQGDLPAWSAAVTALDRDWFQPLRAALRSRRLSAITIVTDGDEGARRFDIRPLDLLKIWRKNRYL